MINSELWKMHKSRILRVRESLTSLESAIYKVNDRSIIDKLSSIVNNAIENDVIPSEFDVQLIADAVVALRSAIALNVSDEYDDYLDDDSPSLKDVKAASGILIANLESLQTWLARDGIIPSTFKSSLVVGHYVMANDISSSVIEIGHRLNSIDNIISAILEPESLSSKGYSNTQVRMFSHFVRSIRRSISLAKANIVSENFIDIAAVLRIIEQILKSCRSFYEGARQMVNSLTESARNAAGRVWDGARDLASSTKTFVDKIRQPEFSTKLSHRPKEPDLLLEWKTVTAIVGGSAAPETWKRLVKNDIGIRKDLNPLFPEVGYVLAAASLPVVSGGIWPNLVRYARYTIESISAERIGRDTARRAHMVEDLHITKDISHQRCIMFVSDKASDIEFEAGSWFSANLGYAVKSTIDDERDDEVYDFAVSLDMSKKVLLNLSKSKLKLAVKHIFSETEISTERKLITLCLLYESEIFDDFVKSYLGTLPMSIAPGFQIGILRSLQRRLHSPPEENASVFEALEFNIKDVVSSVVQQWISDGVVEGQVEEFTAAYERELHRLKIDG